MSSFARRFGLAFCLVVSACADAETKPLPTGGSGGSGAGGSGGGGAAPFCGDGKIDAEEECDTEDFGSATCADYDRPNGSLGCDEYCRITDIGCFREEKCDAVGGVDRDGDGLFGCSDPDCFDHPVCLNPCEAVFASPLEASEPGAFSGLYLPSGHGAEPDATSTSCATALSGGDRIYAFVPAVTGTLRIEADSSLDGMDLSLSLRTTCDAVESELVCSYVPGTALPETLTAQVELGTTYYLIVDGFLPNTLASMLLWMGLDPEESSGSGGSGGSAAAGGSGGSNNGGSGGSG